MTTTSTPRPAAVRAAAALALAAILATGCSSSRGGSADSAGAETAPQAAADSALTGQEAADSTLGPNTAEDAAREVVTTGSATVVAEDPVEAATSIATLAEQAGGRVEQREESRGTGDAPATAHLTLRLPADAVNRTIDALRDVGEVSDVSIQQEDVTASGRDLDARIAALEASTARRTELMAQAANTKDLLAVENELASRQGDLDALRAQRADLSDRVAMSTLDVYVAADESAIARLAPPPTGFRGGLSAGWDALTTFGRAAAVAAGAVLPWLVVAGVVAVVARGVVAGVRKARRRRPDLAGSQPEES
jgi:hypothetical protein